MTTNLFSQIEPFLSSVEHPSRYIDHEMGTVFNEAATHRIALVYPDVYEIGQSNQGLAILYHMVNADTSLSAERAYVPWIDMADVLRKHDLPLFSLESYSPLKEFDMVGFTLPHELACTNILEALDLAQIPLLAKDRAENDPLIIGGGPCSYNPEPLAAFFDVFSIGEGEESLPELCRKHRELKERGFSRKEILHGLAQVKGTYVPSLYACEDGVVTPLYDDVEPIIHKRVISDFNATPAGEQQIVPFAEVTHDRYNLEVLRGCSRGCRFCQAGMIYRPVRERDADSIVSAVINGLACTGYDEVSLTSLSTTDHSQLEDVLRRLNKRFENTGISISIPSQRVDAFGIAMAHLVAGNKKGGLTFAPEAGTQRLRDIINKNVTESDLIDAITAAYQAGWRRCKLYFMCGLPGETDEDLAGIGRLVKRAYNAAKDAVPDNERGNVRMGVSCALFVPKTHTPFQWCGQIPSAEIKRRVGVIRDNMPGKGVDFKWHDASTSFVESTLSRGGREMSDVILKAWQQGARFDAWTEQFSLARWTDAAMQAGVSLEEISTRAYGLEEVLPWSHISCGVTDEYLKIEYKRAFEGTTTSDCTFAACTGCGVCQQLDCDFVVAGGSRG